MQADTLLFEDLEVLYDLLAESVDEVGREQESLFLAKLAMILSHHLNDIDLIRQAISIAKQDLALTPLRDPGQ
jgi:hypothetical protein